MPSSPAAAVTVRAVNVGPAAVLTERTPLTLTVHAIRSASRAAVSPSMNG